MKKPPECQGCPLYDDGFGFVPDEHVPGALVDVWLQNPGAEEELKGQPAIGTTGKILDSELLPRAGLTRGQDVRVRNAIRCRWNNGRGKTNDLPPEATLRAALAHCRVHDTPGTASVAVAAGALPWRLRQGGSAGSITDWRGFLAPSKGPDGLDTLGVNHPADLLPNRNPKMKLAAMLDWQKVKRYLDGQWPKKVPPFYPHAKPDDVETFVDEVLKNPSYVAVDTEFISESKHLTILGIGSPGVRGVQVWWNELEGWEKGRVAASFRRLVRLVPVVFQNAMADIPVLDHNLHVGYDEYTRVDDTMLLHAVLWSDWPHTLEFLASIYGQHRKMKHLSQLDPAIYNWGDVVDTISVYEGLEKELRTDPLSKAVYEGQSLKLIPIILKRQKMGLRVNKDRVRPAIDDYVGKTKVAEALAQAYCGWPINLDSDDQLKRYLYEIKGLPVQKHKDTKKPTVGGDAIAVLRSHIGPEPDLEGEDRDGLSIESALARVQEGADGVLEGRVIHSAAGQILSHYLRPLVNGQRLADRVFPAYKIHAQASGRWSITDPPLGQLPNDLRDILCPDYGYAWVGWDWDQIELRILAALAGDEPYLEAFEKGWDVHTLNACAIFNLPIPEDRTGRHHDPVVVPDDLVQGMANVDLLTADMLREAMREGDVRVWEWQKLVGWRGKDDLRRVFAKRFVYRLNYGGDPRTAGDIPGAKQLGLGPSELSDASRRYLAAHPSMDSWRRRTAAAAQSTRESRTFLGRRRRLLGEGQGLVREAYNHPMQGAVSDIMNLTIVRIIERAPWMTMVHTMHDACTFDCPVDRYEESQKIAEEEAMRPWDVNGRTIIVPAKFKKKYIGPERFECD